MTRVRGVVAALALVVLPALADAACAPSTSGIFPASAIVGTTTDAVVRGTALAGATATVFGDPGLAVTVSSTSDLAVNVHLVADAAAAPGERILAFTTAGGTVAVSFTVNAAGGPVVADVSPALVATRGLPLAATVSGSGLATVTAATIAVSGAGVSVASAVSAPDGTSLALGFDVAADADLGTHAITISNGVGSGLLTLYVQRPAPSVSMVTPAAGELGAAIPITITGTNLSGAALVVSGKPSNGAIDVIASDVATPDDGTLTATLTIPAGAQASTTEARLLIVTTESGQTTTEFFVVPAGVPSVTSVVPGAGAPGEMPHVALQGLNLAGATVTSDSSDVMIVSDVPSPDGMSIGIDMQIAPGAVVDTNHTLTITTGAGSTTATFRVIQAGHPFFSGVRPPFGNRGATGLTLRLDGVNLATLFPGAAGVTLSGPKITESNAIALDDHTAQTTLDIDPTASTGFRDVTVTTTAGTFTRSSAFRVNVPGLVPSITDVTPGILQPGTTTTVEVTGSNFDGAAVLVTGPGVTVANVAVAGGTVITFDATLAPDAPAEIRAVVVITPSGIARCNIASAAPEPPLVAAKLVKPGALFTVTSGAFRLFVFEFSLNDLFTPGLRTVSIPDADGSLALDDAETVAIERAFREAHRGAVRVRAVTATNFIAASSAQSIRR
jgi:hypothetical protein